MPVMDPEQTRQMACLFEYGRKRNQARATVSSVIVCVISKNGFSDERFCFFSFGARRIARRALDRAHPLWEA